jgi:hypothetical protein
VTPAGRHPPPARAKEIAMSEGHDGGRGSRTSRTGLIFCGFALTAAFYLLLEHRAHVLGVLPYLLILLCPAMHLFMHRGHGGHHDHGATPTRKGPAP